MNAWLSSIVVALFAWLPAFAQAADFPTQAVRIVVPFAPGGGTDLAARAIAERLTASLGKPVLVENRPGGNSVIASRIAATALPTATRCCSPPTSTRSTQPTPQLLYDSRDSVFVRS